MVFINQLQVSSSPNFRILRSMCETSNQIWTWNQKGFGLYPCLDRNPHCSAPRLNCHTIQASDSIQGLWLLVPMPNKRCSGLLATQIPIPSRSAWNLCHSWQPMSIIRVQALQTKYLGAACVPGKLTRAGMVLFVLVEGSVWSSSSPNDSRPWLGTPFGQRFRNRMLGIILACSTLMVFEVASISGTGHVVFATESLLYVCWPRFSVGECWGELKEPIAIFLGT